jgi:hypothetical protein
MTRRVMTIRPVARQPAGRLSKLAVAGEAVWLVVVDLKVLQQ